MGRKILLSAVTILIFVIPAQSQDTLVSAFFGLDNALPFAANFLCPGAAGQDGMPVNFKFPIDASSLSETDFEVVDSLGNVHTPFCAVLAPANEDGENRTVLLVGDFGTAGINPPKEVRVVGDLFTTGVLSGETACSEILNMNGALTTNVVPLAEGPSLFFAQKITGTLNECGLGSQTIQVAWNGGITPFIGGDAEADLFPYYTGYADSAGILIPHVPVSIADINDNDNFHQLCFATNDEIVKISIIANTVQDPNGDPNLYSEIEVSDCDTTVDRKEPLPGEELRVYPNPCSEEIYIENLKGNEYFILRDLSGRALVDGECSSCLKMPVLPLGIYYLTILSNTRRKTLKLIKE